MIRQFEKFEVIKLYDEYYSLSVKLHLGFCSWGPLPDVMHRTVKYWIVNAGHFMIESI